MSKENKSFKTQMTNLNEKITQTHIPKKISKTLGDPSGSEVSKNSSSSFIPYQSFKDFDSLNWNQREFKKELEKQLQEKLKSLKKEMEKKAYQEGFKKGENEALVAKSQEIKKKLRHLESLFLSLEKREEELLIQNEENLLNMIYLIGRKLALREISLGKDCLLNLIRKVFENLELETKMILYLSKEDMEFIQSMEREEWEFLRPGVLKSLSLKYSSKISPGGCIVETNYSRVNAELEMRIEKVWKSLESTFLKSDQKAEKANRKNPK